MRLRRQRCVLPAYAGMIRIAEKVVTIPNRAPRVCGDDPPGVSNGELLQVVLPAYAGMIPRMVDGLPREQSAPRVCGDDPYAGQSMTLRPECSPRMRG